MCFIKLSLENIIQENKYTYAFGELNFIYSSENLKSKYRNKNSTSLKFKALHIKIML